MTSFLERLAVLADPALGELSRLMRRGKNETVRRDAASDILDRAGFKPSNKQEISGPEGRPVAYRTVLVAPDPNRWKDDAPPQPAIEPPSPAKPVN